MRTTMLLALIGLAAVAPCDSAMAAHPHDSSFTTLGRTVTPGSHAFPTPPCPSGYTFLVSKLQASPDTSSPDAPFLAYLAGGNVHWSVSVLLMPPGGATLAPLTAIGRGVVHVEASLPAGLPTADPGFAKVKIRVMDFAAAAPAPPPIPAFDVHVTGFCGVP